MQKFGEDPRPLGHNLHTKGALFVSPYIFVGREKLKILKCYDFSVSVINTKSLHGSIYTGFNHF